MLYALEHLVFGGFVTLELIGHNYSWRKALLFEQFAEKPFSGLGVAATVHENVQHFTLGVYSPP